ncbi:MAG: acyl-CoA dehydrogenase family protein [Pseudomonadota bacterium]
MIPRTIFSEEHEMFRDSVRRFVEAEIVPHHAEWEKDGAVSRELWLKAGEAGLLCPSVPEEYGGAGGDFLMTVIVAEELARVGATGPGFALHSEIVAPYIVHYGSEDQKREWLPRMARGEVIGAIAMTEPSAGSDLQRIRTSAKMDGNSYVLNGQKVFITNGYTADLVITAAKTDPTEGARGISLILVPGDTDGFERGRNLEKVGWHAQDTAELFYTDVRVPATNLLGGDEGRGFIQLVQQLPQERLLSALRSASVIEAALDWTVAYTSDRQAFGRPVIGFQNTRFKLAEVKAQAAMMRTFIDRCIELHIDGGGLTADDAAMAKLNSTEMMCQVLDDCLQLHGGMGYMWETPIARAWADNRMARIAGGTSEVMKEIIGRTLGEA